METLAASARACEPVLLVRPFVRSCVSTAIPGTTVFVTRSRLEGAINKKDPVQDLRGFRLMPMETRSPNVFPQNLLL